jgi:Chromo (CHRromatin Organisation MOdifier) domain
MGKFMCELCKQLRIEQNISTAYHPQTDGQSERTNQWLEQYLRVYGNFQQNNWAMLLPLAQFVHNSWPSDVTKRTPFDLLMGFMPKLWSTKTPSTLPEVERRKEWLQLSRDRAQEANQKAQSMVMKRNKQQRGHKAYKPYEEGDCVWLDGKNLHTSHPVAKLAPKHWGPFKVINVINPVSFHLEIPPQWKQKKVHPVFHASLLLPYKETEEHGANYPEPPPDLVEGEEEYEVEDILGSRRHGCRKKLQYLLKWKGYSHAHDSWEPADQVHAPQLVDKFHQETPESAQVVEINSCEKMALEMMPYSSPYNNASSDLGAAILTTFFEETPRVPPPAI